MSRARVVGLAGLAALLLGCGAIFGIPSDVERGGSDAGLPDAAQVPIDAAAAVDAGDGSTTTTIDPGPSCTLAAEFMKPQPVASIMSTEAEANARLSGDGLELYFDAVRAGHAAASDIYRARRTSTAAEFGSPVLLEDTVNGLATMESSPTVTADGKALFFVRGDKADAVVVLRSLKDATGTFGAAQTVEIGSVGRGARDPYVLGNGEEIWFASKEADSEDYDIVRATRSVDLKYDASIAAKGLGSADNDVAPVLTPDGLTIYFASNRTTHMIDEDGSEISLDIYTASRAKKDADFSEPKLVTALSEEKVGETPSWISPDGCRLYFTRDGKDIFVATKPR